MGTLTTLQAGYGWLLSQALQLDGDLARILSLDPPAGVDDEWRRGFYRCRVDLIDLLYPDGDDRTLAVYVSEHRPDSADATAVALLADPSCDLSISGIRRAVDLLR